MTLNSALYFVFYSRVDARGKFPQLRRLPNTIKDYSAYEHVGTCTIELRYTSQHPNTIHFETIHNFNDNLHHASRLHEQTLSLVMTEPRRSFLSHQTLLIDPQSPALTCTATTSLELQRPQPTSISGNTLSRAPLLTPPIIRRPLACVPLPSQVDDGTIVELHPILDPREAPSFEWDMSPDSLEKMLRAHPTIKYLLESATNPALPSLAVVHPQLPWPVTVHRSSVNEESVTVFDVLYAVCEALQTPLSAGGRRLDLLGSRPKFVGLRRCELGGDIWELCVL
ncbi:ste ste20 ysk protein kinase [Moniliophthora roreri]|nr:ste ste20 ysk protein kinase [Moniliophthora roreri]